MKCALLLDVRQIIPHMTCHSNHSPMNLTMSVSHEYLCLDLIAERVFVGRVPQPVDKRKPYRSHRFEILFSEPASV